MPASPPAQTVPDGVQQEGEQVRAQGGSSGAHGKLVWEPHLPQKCKQEFIFASFLLFPSFKEPGYSHICTTGTGDKNLDQGLH